MALGQLLLGQSAALSLIYELIILAICWIFYTVVTHFEQREGTRG
jgi:glycerol transport system permease protein